MAPHSRPLTEGWALLLPLLLAALAATLTRPRLALAPLLGGAVVWLAFRDPERRPLAEPHLALAPADGYVMRVERVWDEWWACDMTQVAIFLALWDVHVQRSPVDAEIVAQHRRVGQYRPAFGRAAASRNTQVVTYLRSEWGPLVLTQISGLLARRIVTWAGPSARLAQGERLGMIKFGSQVTLRVPARTAVLVRPGQHVRAGLTPVADLRS